MRGEEAKKLADDALEELALALDDGHSEALKTFLAFMGRFRRYSVNNQLLISLQRPDATHVAGFNRWKELRRYVKAGEKGILIIAPMVLRKRADDSEGEAMDEKGAESVLRYKAVHVFDVSQTDGRPLPELHRVGGNPKGHIERLKELVAARGIRLEYTHDLGGAEGISCGGIIKLRPGLPPGEEFSVLTHELGHELLHRDGANVQTTRTVRETEAEAVAFVVCQATGLDTNTAAADYIQLYDGTKETLLASLERIRRTAVEILDAIDGPPAQLEERMRDDSHVEREVARESQAELVRAA